MNLDYVKRVMGLEGKKAIVTGGNSGIGKSVAIAFASMGADVTIAGRDLPTIGETVSLLKELNPACTGIRLDVSKKAEVDAFFGEYCRANDNRLDILVANAGVCNMLRALETMEDDVDYFFDINYKGTLFCCQQAAKIMKERQSGSIVIVTSVNALYAHPPQAAYSSTKSALENLMRCLAVDLAPFNIRVNSCAPGAIRTNIGRNNPNRGDQQSRDLGKFRSKLPLGRIGEPEDIGDAIACIASDAFRYMTGSTILVDGGLMLRNI